MLTHHDIWNAIDRLAQRHGLSPSGLAKKAGLSSTLFNPSKRQTKKRKRWPSTESIAAILQATGSSIDEFIALANPYAVTQTKIPILSIKTAAQKGHFNEDTGKIIPDKWDEMLLPASTDPHAFALEIEGNALEPIYHDGDTVIVSPIEKPRRNDRVAICTRQGEILIRQLGREGAQKIELIPFNSEAPSDGIDRSEILWMNRILWVTQ